MIFSHPNVSNNWTIHHDNRTVTKTARPFKMSWLESLHKYMSGMRIGVLFHMQFHLNDFNCMLTTSKPVCVSDYYT